MPEVQFTWISDRFHSRHHQTEIQEQESTGKVREILPKPRKVRPSEVLKTVSQLNSLFWTNTNEIQSNNRHYESRVWHRGFCGGVLHLWGLCAGFLGRWTSRTHTTESRISASAESTSAKLIFLEKFKFINIINYQGKYIHIKLCTRM